MTRSQGEKQGALRITQVRSRIGNQERVVRVLVDGLGLGRIGSRVVLPDNPYTRGMIAKVAHIVRFEEIEAPAPAAAKSARKASAARASKSAAKSATTAAKAKPARKAPAARTAAKSAEAAPAAAPEAEE